MNTEFEPQSWTKMLRKIHLVCFILEYFTPKTRTLKILSPPPQKTMLKGHRNISGPDLTTLIREGLGEGPLFVQDCRWSDNKVKTNN